MKHCSKCKSIKAIDQFSKNKSRKDGLSVNCKSCEKARYNKDYHKKYNKKHEEKIRFYKRNLYYKKHFIITEQHKQWRLANPSKVLAIGHNYRARKAAAQGSATDEQIDARMAYYGYNCIYCGGEYQEADHFFPLSKGGTGWAANFVPSCKSCNTSKNARDPWQFIHDSHMSLVDI